MTVVISDQPKVVAQGFVFAEDPRWRDGSLYFSDMLGGKVYSLDVHGNIEMLVEIDDVPSGLGFMPNGDLLIVSAFKEKLLRLTSIGIAIYADLAPMAGYGINDMLVDQHGRAYVVQFGFDYRARREIRPSPLLTVSPEGQVGIAAPDLHVGNGMALSEDGRSLFVAESAVDRITTFDVDQKGELSRRRLFAQLPEGHHPDGLCLDQEGAIWVAVLHHGLIRVEEGGRITHRLPMNGRNATACMLGGDHRRDLYICMVETLNHDAARAARTSSIARLTVDVPGCGLP